ncbi:aldo/keto reductase [Psychrobium sp. 1_MG-2023]|uniref:aldo/keto reductase n=1 Tax=Psychrobium sp. 1_MG-2023 TaxID=3062624 RepID=UPI000C33228F|nr:aldo/keto reductase [Psychrobium sp. 1_MG-2023]MDP2559773.1 aldo/keto reductase [Psychrobium sp. 1_MG-2023]PKF59119.1 aldo/keto reductase [Alteromonadales bacterium alter-6D02]
MEFSKLGSSGLDVSRVCLGSMTWGLQNNQADANAQIDYALSQQVNFIDTAEMYAVPPSAETYGKTETIIGNWLCHNQQHRQDIILATKVAGPGLSWVRQGAPITGKTVISAVEGSLKRLQTDYIDLYQLHWPNRQSPHFAQHWPGTLNFTDLDSQAHTEQMLDILQGLAECVKAGKIRHCGLSDDTPWGINEYLRLSQAHDLPRMVSIQNEFSLLHTKDWPYLIEQCVHQDIAYLPWSPLATGMLTGKYLNGERPSGSRWTLMQRNGLFRDTPQSEQAVRAYVELAKAYNLAPAALALAWCNQVNGVSSTIIGATTQQQLIENIAAFEQPLSQQILADITDILRQYPSPF